MSQPYVEVIGDPIAHSKSPDIHGFWLDRLGIDASYSRQHVTSGQLEDYLAGRRQDDFWRGCNVTMPHKQAIIPLLDALDPLAERVGAVNTVVRSAEGLLTGYNTDVPGFLEPLNDDLAQKHLFRMARILGTGGAAKAVITALSGQGVVIVLAGRSPEKAAALMQELAPEGEHHIVPLDHFASRTDFAFDDREGCFDLIVNTTPLGMRGQPPLPFHFSHAPPGSIVYDIVTDPLETALLRAANDAGFRTIDGLAMLIGQAAAAFELFFGASPPRDLDAELKERLTA